MSLRQADQVPQIEAARWLSSRGIFAAGSDTVAFERVPAAEMPVHIHLLVESGIHIIENLNLEDLARDRVFEFVFVGAPLKIRGGTGPRSGHWPSQRKNELIDELDAIVFDHRIREHIARDRLDLRLRRCAVRLRLDGDVEVFTLADCGDNRMSMRVQCGADRLPLRIEHRRLERHEDASFHGKHYCSVTSDCRLGHALPYLGAERKMLNSQAAVDQT